MINSSIGVAERDYKWQILHSSEPSWRGLYIYSYDGNNKIYNQVAGFEAEPENRFRVLGKIKGKAFIKDGGTATQFLKADGSVDSTAYVNKAGDTMTGTLGVKNTLNINSSEAMNHIALNRAGHNYITATRSGGIIALTSNGKAPNSESGELYISNNVVYPGKDSTIQLGTSGKKWSQSHVVQSYVYGRLIVSKSSGDCRILMGNQDSAGVNKPFVIKSQNGILELGVGNSWSGVDGGTFTQYAALGSSFIQAPGFKKTGGTNTQILLANGEVGTLWKGADLTSATTDFGVTTPKFVGLAIAKFSVTSLGTSGNYLTWTKNGTANILAVPYASKAGGIAMPVSSEITKHPGDRIASFITQISSSTTGLFPHQNNANALLTINTHPGNYIHQLGFSGNKQMYHRAFSAVAIDTSTAWNKILTSANYATVLDTRYIRKTGGISGDLILDNDSSTGIRQVRLQCANNDYGRIAVGGTAPYGGWMEIATADDGSEPIYVRQYSDTYTTIRRTATLLDAAGNTTFPGKLTIRAATGIAPINVSSTTVCTNLNADMLDGTHKSGLLTALTASGNRITCTVGGTSKTCDINSVGGLTVYKFTKPDNSGNPCYILISDVTNWYNQGTTGTNGGHHGIVGTIISEREGNLHATYTASIIAMCSYNRSFHKLQTNGPQWIKPMVVRYNNKYYIALFCSGSGHDFYVIGRGYDVSTIQTLNADADGLVFGLDSLRDFKPTGIEVLIDNGIFFNNRDSQYSIRAIPTSNMHITTPPMKGIILNGGLICVESGEVLFSAAKQKVYLLNYAKLLEQGFATMYNRSDFLR